MRSVLLSDLSMVRKNLVNGVFITICLVVFFSVIDGNVLPAIIIGPVSLGYVSLMVLFSFDEQNKWQEMRLALPVSRTDVVMGRYISILLCSLLGAVVVLVVIAVLALLAAVLPVGSAIAACLDECNPGSIVLMVGISLVFSLAATALAAPVVFRMGFTGAVRYLPFAFFALVAFGACIAKLAPGGQSAGAWIGGMLDAVALHLTPLGFGFALIVGMLTVYAASAALSAKLYLGRSF